MLSIALHWWRSEGVYTGSVLGMHCGTNRVVFFDIWPWRWRTGWRTGGWLRTGHRGWGRWLRVWRGRRTRECHVRWRGTQEGVQLGKDHTMAGAHMLPSTLCFLQWVIALNTVPPETRKLGACSRPVQSHKKGQIHKELRTVTGRCPACGLETQPKQHTFLANE